MLGLALGSLLHVCPLSEATEYSVDGNILYDVYYDNEIFVEQEDAFTVNVRDTEWQIRSVPKRFVKMGKEQALGDYTIVSSDRTNIYQLNSFESFIPNNIHFNQISAIKTNAPGTNINKFDARLVSGSIPYGLSDPKLIVLWYAFASSSYLTNARDSFLFPPTVLPPLDYVNDVRVEARWELSDRPPFLPKNIYFDNTPKYKLLKLSPPGHDLHYTNCLYHVVTSHEETGLSIPKDIIIHYYEPHPFKSGLTLHTAYMRITSTNYRTTTITNNYRPGIPDRTTISDMRTISSNRPFGVLYRNQTNWPTLKQSEDRSNIILKNSRKRVLSFRQLVACVCFAGVLAIPVLVAVKNKWR